MNKAARLIKRFESRENELGRQKGDDRKKMENSNALVLFQKDSAMLAAL